MFIANEDVRGILCLCGRTFCMFYANKCRNKSYLIFGTDREEEREREDEERQTK